MNFFDQYKHPNWQNKRLEVLEAANFTCERCFDPDSQLHVHHKRYVKGRKVWEYDRAELAVLCDTCHAIVHSEKEAIQELIVLIPVDSIPEIVALVANYCAFVEGPCRGSDFTGHQMAMRDEKFASSIGKAAAVVGNNCSIDAIVDFTEKLALAKQGDSVAISVKGQAGRLYDPDF